MTDRAAAQQLVEEHIGNLKTIDINCHFMILEDATQERPGLWWFEYESSHFVDTENELFAESPGPVVVVKGSGELVQLPQSDDHGEAVAAFEAERGLG